MTDQHEFRVPFTRHELAPGETQWRTFTREADVTVPTRIALVGAGLLAAFAGVLIGAERWPHVLWWIPGIWTGIGSVLFFIVNRKAFKLDETFYRTREREPEPVTVLQQPPQERTVTHHEFNHRDNQVVFTKLPDTTKWVSFMQEVLKPNTEVPFTFTGAKKYKIVRNGNLAKGRFGFKEMRDTLVKRGWAVWNGEPGTTKGVSLTVAGRNKLEETYYAPAPATQETGSQ
jgi:hypothetical protein